MLIEKSLRDFAAVVKSDAPTPGGGSVSAYAGMLGASLANMVGGLTVGKKNYEEIPHEHRSALETNETVIEALIEKLDNDVDDDTKAFDKVVAGYKMPKETEEEKRARTEAIQEGYKAAIEVPLACAKDCIETLERQQVYTEYGNVNAITDIGVGTLLAHAGAEGALLNVSINLGSIKDEAYRMAKEREVAALLERAHKQRDVNVEAVYRRLNA